MNESDPTGKSADVAGASPRQSRRTGDWIVLAWIVGSLVGLVWTPYDPQAQAFRGESLAGSSPAHLLGIDGLGRDVLSRVWRGSGHTVVLGAMAAAGTMLAAALLLALERRGPRPLRGVIRAGVAGGLALPVLFVGLILLVFLPASPWTLVLACALGGVPFGFRQLRVMWVEQAGALHVLASRALGATTWHLAWFSIWPNIRPQAASLAKLLFAVAVLELSGLSFLGLTGDPDLAELGAILRQNQAYLFQRPALVVWPGALLCGLLLVVHLSNVRARAADGTR